MSSYSASFIKSQMRIDRASDVPLYWQISRSLRTAITNDVLSPGARLPSTRSLADALEVSRNTAINTYNQLRTEGYLESRVGSGTYVSETLPENSTQARRSPDDVSYSLELADTNTRSVSLSERAREGMGRRLSMLEHPCSPKPFRPGIPALDAFPKETWSKLVSRRWESLPAERLVYGNPAGFPRLRKVVAEYLRTARGVRCEAEQVLIVSGVQQALTLTARTLLDHGDPVWVEDPGFPRMQKAFAAAGAETHPMPVDEEGLQIAPQAETSFGDRTEDGQPPSGRRSKEASPQMVGVTPSHQFPLGVTMSLSRRIELLEWAARTDTWIFEDDYDSEYRYSDRPIAALQGLDNAGRVLYAGTFSKVLFPALRLGYLVVPPDLVEPFARMRSLTDRCPPRVQQMVLSDFIEEGHFEQHIQQMRPLYAARQSALLDALDEHLSDQIDIEASDAGLHLVGWLSKEIDDQAASERLKEADIVAPPLSFYSDRPLKRGGLLLGYGGVSKEEIREGVERMADVLEALREEETPHNVTIPA